MAARQALDAGWFPGGVLFIDMCGYHADKAVQAGVAAGQLLRALGVRDTDLPPTEDEQLILYRSILEQYARDGRRLLIVADNVATSGQLIPLLPAHSSHRLLVTSRHTLSLTARYFELDILAEAEALALLRTALHVAEHDLRVEIYPDQAIAIVELCGYLPLALQIIAALMRAEPDRPLVEMAAELTDARDRLAVLDTGDADEWGRPVAVRAAFDLSYHHLLSQRPEQARIFRLMPLNPGTDISTDAAAALAGQPQAAVRRHLAALARAHLITRGNEGRRWGMHDLLRLYADEHGRDSSDADDRERALDRLLDHYLVLADKADDCLLGPLAPAPQGTFRSRDKALAWFDDERLSLLGSVSVAYETRRFKVALDLPGCLNRYLRWRGYYSDRITIDVLAVDAARQLPDASGEGIALNNLGNALGQVRDFDEAIHAYRGALAIYRQLGDQYRAGLTLGNLATALAEVRRFDEAVSACEEALVICRHTGDQHGEAQALNNLGIVLREVRRFEEAIAAHRQALDLWRHLGDLFHQGMAWNNLGLALSDSRSFQEAVEVQQQALEISQKMQDRYGEQSALNNLGSALLRVRNYAESIAAHQKALEISRQLEDQDGERSALNNLGLALAAVGDFDEAISIYEQALNISRQLGKQDGEAEVLNNLGLALIEVALYDQAKAAFRDVITICRHLGMQHREAAALSSLGQTFTRMGLLDEAIAAHQKGLEICRDIGDKEGEFATLIHLGDALRAFGRSVEAEAIYQQAITISDTLE
ncbi:tetratricopeptide (TPR) repeat protein [Sphaerisporangium siamense]|uniref:Tetratricopeptide (TPR) repeat protein n=1 Tax=Sphaerisporangium siamense TaxID=795645 RepID=A0A7W7GAM1_9ACTN|nr:tetratricopeptide (TPR) repeat protein [Sphaerisporangium siamense]